MYLTLAEQCLSFVRSKNHSSLKLQAVYQNVMLCIFFVWYKNYHQIPPNIEYNLRRVDSQLVDFAWKTDGTHPNT